MAGEVVPLSCRSIFQASDVPAEPVFLIESSQWGLKLVPAANAAMEWQISDSNLHIGLLTSREEADDLQLLAQQIAKSAIASKRSEELVSMEQELLSLSGRTLNLIGQINKVLELKLKFDATSAINPLTLRMPNLGLAFRSDYVPTEAELRKLEKIKEMWASTPERLGANRERFSENLEELKASLDELKAMRNEEAAFGLALRLNWVKLILVIHAIDRHQSSIDNPGSSRNLENYSLLLNTFLTSVKTQYVQVQMMRRHMVKLISEREQIIAKAVARYRQSFR